MVLSQLLRSDLFGRKVACHLPISNARVAFEFGISLNGSNARAALTFDFENFEFCLSSCIVVRQVGLMINGALIK